MEAEFKKTIIDALKRSKAVKPDMIEKINFKVYELAFTPKHINPEWNYELYESLGDLSVNKAIGYYCYHRFPQIHCASGVKILARLRINYVQKSFLAKLSEKLDFAKIVIGGVSGKDREKLMEDIFEAFIGATELTFDNIVAGGYGAVVVYDIIQSLLDVIDISLKYVDLFDAKTRLKQMFDKNPGLTKLEFQHVLATREANVYGTVNGQRILLATTTEGKNVAEKEKAASKIAIDYLVAQGFKSDAETAKAFETICP